MLRLCARIFVFLSLIVLPHAAYAAMPGNVTGVKAAFQNGEVTVNWNKPAGEDITYYRIFYSHESILNNQGLYDDFEIADGSDTTHTLSELPPGDELFIAVLAVNSKGEESAGFQEEAKVTLRAVTSAPASQAATASSQAASSVTTDNGEKLRVLSVTAITETGVLITFSHPASVTRDEAATSFTVRDASGSVLAVRRLIIEGPLVTLVTMPQVRNRVYTLTVSQSVSGISNGKMIALDTQQPPTLFTGSVEGQDLPSSTGPSGSEVRNLRINAVRSANGTYVVEVTWQAPATGDVKEYYVSQSVNGGRTYGPQQTVAKAANGTKISGVPAGQFAVIVRTGYSDNVVSRGVSETLTLPSGLTPVQGNVTPPATGGSIKTPNLPSSGPALAIVAMAAGGIGGWQFMRRKRA